MQVEGQQETANMALWCPYPGPVDEFILFCWAAGSLLLALGAVLLIPFGLPGNWLLVAAGFCGLPLGFGWRPILLLGAAAAFAEIVELLSTTKLTKKAGAGKAGMWGSFLGAIGGAILFTPLIPIPILGTLLGSGLGAMAGAILFEWTFSGKDQQELLTLGFGALVGVLLGRTLKVAIGAAQLTYWGLVVFRMLPA